MHSQDHRDAGWTPDSWQARPAPMHTTYDDPAALREALTKLRSLPPLCTPFEIDRLRSRLAEAQEGRRFLLQGGDCAETLRDCRPEIITNKIKILLQMSLVLLQGCRKPLIRIGRLAGQYAKPRSNPLESREVNGARVELPSYFGDLVNHPEFTPEARRADPQLLISAYYHAALTLNYIRALTEGGFADLHHPEYWDLAFCETADLSPDLRAEYQGHIQKLTESLRFMEALGENPVEVLSRAEFYVSHEGLNLHYEAAQTRHSGSGAAPYDLTTHLPWIGERTRDLRGAHVEFFRGVKNPIGVKLGPKADPAELLELLRVLNPNDEAGKLVLIARMGEGRVAAALPPLVEAVRRAGRRVLWVCDPMHGNTHTTASGLKTRSFDRILRELEQSLDVHQALGSTLGGVHFELTGEDVTECLGAGTTEDDLDKNYASLCDPRLNYRQAMEVALRLARRLSVT